MAELFLARTKGIEGFEKLVVVKRILPRLADDAKLVGMFLNEARLAAQLHHPNIAQVYDIGVEAGEYFFSMEYVHGEDLGRIIAAATENGVGLSLDAALTLGAGLCAGLHHAHDKADAHGQPLGIVHRDVSPSNVLVSYDGAVKLVDFGIARATSTTKGSSGGLKGKLAFMSPEQCRGQPLDRRSDLYAVGTMLYELTTGQTPFAGASAFELLNHIVHTDVPPPSAIVAEYPEALEQIVLRALARDPAKRFATARDLQGALEDFAHESRLRVSPLVLARLMSTLFPARLEEWERARAAGAFFVEQHVVRTLIEAGKTGDLSPLAIAAAATAAAAALADAPEPEPEPAEPTSVTQPLDLGATDQHIAIVAPGPGGAVSFEPRLPPDLDEAIGPPLPAPVPAPVAVVPRRVPTPVAGLPELSRPELARAVAMPSAAELRVGDVTEMVRPLDHVVRRPLAPQRRTGLWVALIAGLIAAGVIAAVATGGDADAPRITPRAVVAPPLEPTVDPLPLPVAPAPVAAPPVAEPAPVPVPVVAPIAHPAVRPRPRAHPVAHARPGDPKWSDDSVFMPVRTEP